MNDVLPESRGFLLIEIDRWGYMSDYEGGTVVHRESRDIQDWATCYPSLSEAKEQLDLPASNSEEIAVLQLTSEGGGAAIWMREEQKELLVPRLDRFRGCYGTWPVRTLNI